MSANRKSTRRNSRSRSRKQQSRKRSATRKYSSKGGVFGFFAKGPAMADIEMGNVKRIKELVAAGAQVQYVCTHTAHTGQRTPRSPGKYKTPIRA